MLNWPKRYIEGTGGWMAIPNILLKNIGNITWLEFFTYNIAYEKYLNKDYSYFYDICTIWRNIKLREKSNNNILLEPIWLNENIQINKKNYLWPKWRDKGLIRLKDLYEPNLTIKTLTSLMTE